MSTSASPGNLEILLVDDDKVVSLLHKNRLKAAKIEQTPRLFCHGQQAIEYLRTADSKGKTFLVLLDLNMPVLNGWDFLEQLKKNDLAFNIYVVVITSSLFSRDRKRAFEYQHVIAYYQKPLLLKHVEDMKKKEQLSSFFEYKPSVK